MNYCQFFAGDWNRLTPQKIYCHVPPHRFSPFYSSVCTSFVCQYFEYLEEAIWAVEVLKESGLPVACSLCIGPEGDMRGISPGECAVRLAKAGKLSRYRFCIIPIFSVVGH